MHFFNSFFISSNEVVTLSDIDTVFAFVDFNNIKLISTSRHENRAVIRSDFYVWMVFGRLNKSIIKL